jgi:hypothetical protein
MKCHAGTGTHADWYRTHSLFLEACCCELRSHLAGTGIPVTAGPTTRGVSECRKVRPLHTAEGVALMQQNFAPSNSRGIAQKIIGCEVDS